MDQMTISFEPSVGDPGTMTGQRSELPQGNPVFSVNMTEEGRIRPNKDMGTKPPVRVPLSFSWLPWSSKTYESNESLTSTTQAIGEFVWIVFQVCQP